MFKEIYEGICGTNVGATSIHANDAIREYVQKKAMKSAIAQEMRGATLEEIERRERMAKINKEFIEAEKARSQKINSCDETQEQTVFEDIELEYYY